MSKLTCKCGAELGVVVELKRWSSTAQRILPYYVCDRYVGDIKVARFFGRGELWCECGERVIWDANKWKLERLVVR